MRIEPWQKNLAALFLAQTLSMVGFSFVFPFFPLYIQTLGVPDPTVATQWTGVITAAGAITMAVAQPVWGNLADRVGRRPMVIRSMVAAAITLAAMGFVTSPEQLLIARLIQGGVTGTVAASNALVATSTPKERVGFALGLMQVALFLGMSVGPLLGGAIADNLGYRAPFFVAALLMAIGLLLIIVLVKEKFVSPSQAGVASPGAVTQSRAVLGIALFPTLAAIMFVIHFGGVIVMPMLSVFVAELGGAANAATMAGVVLGAGGAMSAVSAVVVGRIGDSYGHHRILPICLVGAAVSFAPQAFVQDVWQLLALRMLLGLFLGGLMPSANALVVALVPSHSRGAAFGLTTTALAMANFAGPLATAGIVGFWGLRAVFIVTTLVFAVASIWVAARLRNFASQVVVTRTVD
jgi:DHA1 family multidrug resistance protein-like MFS transporter